MRSKRGPLLPYLAASAVLLAGLGAARPAHAQAQRAFVRHPQRPDARPKPAGIPVDYVFTHGGFLHPSCVTYVQSDEILGADFVIRGFDGTVRDQILPCAYPRYDFKGNTITDPRPVSHAGGGGGSGTYDGWLEWYDTSAKIASGLSLSTEFIVPTPPTNVGSQDIALFNGFQSPNAIVQPVLDFSELAGMWAIECEVQYGQNGDVQSTLVAVNPGDTLLGTVTPSNCSSSGVCTWTIVLKDLTTGKSSMQTTMAVTDPVDDVVPAVLETYGVSSCDMLPASGEVPFLQNSVTDAHGAVQQVNYGFKPLSQAMAAAEVPTTCGWNGNASGNDFTLIFGMNPTLPPGADAGPIGSSSSSGSSSGAAGSSSGAGSTGSSSGGSSNGSSGGVSSGGSSGGVGSSGSSSGGLGSSNGGSSGGAAGGDGGANDGFASSSGSSGCGCETVGLRSSDLGLAGGLGLLLALAIRRRRLERRRD